MKPTEAPWLDGWVNASGISTMLGISRQTVNQMIHDGEFKTLSKFGSPSKPQFMVKTDEVEKMKETRTFPRSGN